MDAQWSPSSACRATIASASCAGQACAHVLAQRRAASRVSMVASYRTVTALRPLLPPVPDKTARQRAAGHPEANHAPRPARGGAPPRLGAPLAPGGGATARAAADLVVDLSGSTSLLGSCHQATD